MGRGFVNFVSLDLTTTPFDGWPGATAFWEKLISPGSVYPEWLPTDISASRMQMEQMEYPLGTLPSLDLPSVGALSILLAIYILLVGPVNYGVLHRVRQLHWAWITIPAITVIFSAGAFGLGYSMRGNDLILNRIALVTLQPGGAADVTSYVGLFSPARQSYEIEVSGDGLVSPIVRNADPWSMQGPSMPGAEMVIVQGPPHRLKGVSINQWSMQSFVSEGRWQDFGDVEATFSFEQNQLVGQIRNHTAYPLSDTTIIWGEYFARVGDLPVGEEIEVTVPLTSTTNVALGYSLGWRLYQDTFEPSGRMSRQVELKRILLDNLLQGPINLRQSMLTSSGDLPKVYLLTWVDSTSVGLLQQAPPTVTVEGRAPTQQTLMLVHTTFGFELPERGAVFLPPGVLPGRMVELPPEGGLCGPGNVTAIYLGRGDAILEFKVPPAFADIQIEKLRLSMLSDGGWEKAPVTHLYDWDEKSWLALESPQLGVNMLDYQPGLADGDGRIRVRISQDGGGGGCLYVNMGLDGKRGGVEG
jgi:hypothetical protein